MVNISDERKRERDAFIHFVIRDSRQMPELEEVLHREGAEKSMRELADWLLVQKEAGHLAIADPMSSARMLMDMLFGAMGGPLSRNWPNREARSTHMSNCIATFIRGSRHKAPIAIPALYLQADIQTDSGSISTAPPSRAL